MQPDDNERVTLELDRRSELITGSLTDERGTSTQFSGWLALARLLERVRNRSSGQSADQPTDLARRDQG